MIDLHSNTYRNNPYPTFKEMRNNHPIFPLPQKGCYAISRYQDVKEILKNDGLFSSEHIVKEPTLLEPDFLFHTRGMVGTDKPEHTRLKKLLSNIFSQYKFEHLESMTQQYCRQLLAGIKPRGSIDFIKDFAAPLPIMMMANLLGMDTEKTEQIRQWVLILLTWRLHHYPNKDACIKNMFNYLNEQVNKRKFIPEDNIISNLLFASVDGNQALSKEEIFAFIRLLLVGGTDTTTNLLGNVMHTLLKHPFLISLLQKHPEKIDDFIEETLRYDGPVLSLCRRVKEDVEWNGVIFKKNNLVFPLISSANHDESVFKHPEEFDIKPKISHLSFGFGIHYCFSSKLAKLQVKVALKELLQSYHHFERANDMDLEFIESFFFRGLKKLEINIK